MLLDGTCLAMVDAAHLQDDPRRSMRLQIRGQVQSLRLADGEHRSFGISHAWDLGPCLTHCEARSTRNRLKSGGLAAERWSEKTTVVQTARNLLRGGIPEIREASLGEPGDSLVA